MDDSNNNTGTITSDDNQVQVDPNENSEQKEKRIATYVKFDNGRKFRDWIVKEKIDEGGFGKVYLMENKKKPNQRAALKAEPNEVEGGSAIKLEIEVIRAINPKGDAVHVPYVFHAAKHKRYSYMIMTLLGPNFKKIRIGDKKEKPGDPWTTLPVSTWIRLGIQCLYAIKTVHDNGYIHRDIKPNNFVVGDPLDDEKSRVVYILDFGLSRSYAFKKNGGWVHRIARKSADFRGTARYCSPNVHDSHEQGRHDDLWSLIYVLIELHCGLPWQTTREKSRIEMLKCNMKDEDLMINMPKELRSIIPALRKNTCYTRPDYLAIYQSMIEVMKRYKVHHNDPYEWEKKGKIPKPTKRPDWVDAEDFFKADPIGINGPPVLEVGQVESLRKEEATQ